MADFYKSQIILRENLFFQEISYIISNEVRNEKEFQVLNHTGMKITDMHSHILPGLDDGAKTIEETLFVLEEAQRQNVGRIIVTPHFHPEHYPLSGTQVRETLQRVQQACAERGISVELYAGQECFYHTGLLKDLEEGKALTLADSRYVLVEFDPQCPYFYLLRGLQELIRHGYFPILAHYERYACLSEEEQLEELKWQGVLLQLNFDTLRRHGRWFRGNPFQKDLKAGFVDYLGSDCHGTKFRPLRIREACRWLEKHLSEEWLEKILHINIERILEDGT